MSKFWKWSNAVDSDDSELILDGPISDVSWWGDEVTPQEFRDELKKHKGEALTVVLNSGGGDVFAGLSIYNALRELDTQVTVRVDGLAASIASIIAMAGDEIIMSPGSMMMIHRPSVFAMGNVEDLDKAKEVLTTIEDSILPIYVDRTGLSTDEVTEMLNAETWMSGERAVELGFADSIAKTSKEKAEVVQNAFNGNFAFSMAATKKSLDSLVEKVAKAKAEAEDTEVETEVEPEVEAPAPEPAPAAPEPTKVEEVTEASTKETKPVEDNEEIMNKQDKVAAEAVVAQAKPEQTATPSNSNYLKTEESVQDFAKILESNAGESAQEVKAAWGNHLGAKMGVTNPTVLLPGALITEIEDAFKEGGQIWNLVNKTGLSVFRAAWDTVTGEDSRGKGYNRADAEDKVEELITLADRVIRPQFVYKYITLNKEDVKENRDTGALVRYVLSELPRRIVREVERAIVIGDGRIGTHAQKIDSFLSLKADATAAEGTAVEYQPALDESRYESLLRAKALVKAEGAKYLVAKSGWMTDLLLMQTSSGGFVWAPGSDVASALGFAGVIEPDWFDDTSDAENDAYIFVPSAYTAVGDNSIEAYTNFALKQNKQEYLQEIYAGGALSKLKSAVAITVPATV